MLQVVPTFHFRGFRTADLERPGRR